MTGIKHDKGKVRTGLMMEGFAYALKEVAEVSTFGAEKYGENTWQEVEIERYRDAFFRHLLDWMSGEEYDDESGLKSLAHAAWNILAILELDEKPSKISQNIYEDKEDIEIL